MEHRRLTSWCCVTCGRWTYWWSRRLGNKLDAGVTTHVAMLKCRADITGDRWSHWPMGQDPMLDLPVPPLDVILPSALPTYDRAVTSNQHMIELITDDEADSDDDDDDIDNDSVFINWQSWSTSSSSSSPSLSLYEPSMTFYIRLYCLTWSVTRECDGILAFCFVVRHICVWLTLDLF